MAGTEYNALVIQKLDVASGLMILRVTAKGWQLPPFKAGQYTVLGLLGSAQRAAFTDPEEPPAATDKLIRRAYSVASSSVENEYIEFFITLVRSGALTPRLFALRPGGSLWLSPKMVGMFTMDSVPSSQNIVLVATGTGLAPYMSMLRTHLPEIRDTHVAVIHGARHSWDLGYRAELATMQRLVPRFAYVPIVSKPEEEPFPWKGHTGFINDLWSSPSLEKAAGFKPSPEHTHIFLCGNPLMIEAMLQQVGSQGWTEHTPQCTGNIHLEKFW